MKLFSQYKLILIIGIFFTTFYNISFFNNVVRAYEFEGINILYICSLVIVLVAFTVFLFTLLSSKYTTKPFLIITLLTSSFTAYFMDTYHVVIDDEMIRNSLQTNLSESSDLFSFQLVIYVLLLGILPSYFIYKVKIDYRPFKRELFFKIGTLLLSLLFIVLTILAFSKFYTSFFREHKPLRYHINPIYWIYSVGNYINKTINSGPLIIKPIGVDAKIISTNDPIKKKKLIIMVVGEATRADRFSLNGYKKETNPLLKKEDLVSFSNLYSCGTSTAHSVPCMFSVYDRNNYTYKKGITTESLVDVLSHTQNIKVLWRDNNSNSKGVANRIDYEDYRSNKNNTICDNECRDEGMLVGLNKYIEKNKDKSILIILHQMGNHGPAYYKRYPKAYEKFTPVCKTNQLEQCTQEEVSNAYDNAVLYSDYFLSKTINFLKPYSKDYKTAMIYMSDHGESLGENGLYLHGMPYFMAPKEQTHVASLMWFGEGGINKDVDVQKLKSYSNKKFSHDNLFHTLLSIFEVDTEVYNKNLDLLNYARKDLNKIE